MKPLTSKRPAKRMRRLVKVFVCVSVLAGAYCTALAQIVESVDAVGITVADIDRSTQFFSHVLGFQKVSDARLSGREYERLQDIVGAQTKNVRMKLGDQLIELTEYIAPKGRPIPSGSRSHDHWFQHIAIVVSDMDKAYRKLRSYNVEHTSTRPQRIPDWNQAAAGIQAFYFKDPDGHNLELIYFPPGKGDPKWQHTGGRLFLGIDHTAITVSDTERSLLFYRDLLGMRVAGESENYGTEQENLNGVPGSRVRITGLRAASGFGVEFLHYLTPGNGRATPADSRANDLWHWHTVMRVGRADAAAARLELENARFVSTGVVRLPGRGSQSHKSFLVRDPDSHALKLVGK